MRRHIAAFVLLLALAATGCTSRGSFPVTTGTQVDLAQKNFRVVKGNAIGKSFGFRLLGILPFAAPSYTKAMSDLYGKFGIETGSAQTLVNVVQERSTLYLILFSIPRLTVRADIVEFTD